jgi:hypothetical protein
LCSKEKVCLSLFSQFWDDFSAEQPYLRQQASAQVVYDFLLQHNNKLSSFVSELMDL